MLINKIKSYLFESLFRNAIFLMMGNMAPSFIGYAFWIVIAQFYGPEVVGLTAAVVMSISLLVGLSDLGLGIGLIYFIPKQKTEKRQLIRSSLTIALFSAFIFAVIYICIIPYFNHSLLFIYENPVYVVLFIAGCLAGVFNYILGSVFMSYLQSKYVFYQQVSISTMRLLLILPLTYVFSNDMEIVFSLIIATVIVMLLTQYLIVPKVLHGDHLWPSSKVGLAKPILPYSLSNYVGRLLLESQQSIIPIIVINSFGAAVNGYFYLAWIPALILRVIPNAMFNSLFSELSHDTSNIDALIVKALRHASFILLPAVLIMYFLSDIILLMFGGDYIRESSQILKILVLSNIPWMITYLAITITRARGEPKYTTAISAALFTLVIVCVGFAAQHGEILNLAYGFLIAHSIVAISLVLTYILRRTKRVQDN